MPELIGPHPAHEVPKAWDRVSAHIDAANGRSGGRYSAVAVFEALLSGRMQLWTIEGDGTQAAVITELVTYPTGLTVLSFVAVTGKRRPEWQHLWREIAAWGKTHGATKAESWARRGWARVMARDGWKESHRLIEVDI